MQKQVMKRMEDGQLIVLAKANPKMVSLAVRVKARKELKERGFRFVGMRIERDE